jgi:hypothetical protein
VPTLDTRSPSPEDADALGVERAMGRVRAGCGTAAAIVVASIAVISGTIAITPWIRPALAHQPGYGQGMGFILIPVVLAAPIVGLVAAWRPRIGVALGTLLVLGLAGLCVRVLADG